jgi:CubicO group peptidase (beta-lactamase class C family)
MTEPFGSQPKSGVRPLQSVTVVLDPLRDWLRERGERGSFSGVVRIDQAGTPVFTAAHGLASRAWNRPVTSDTRFDTASITKLFTAVAALQQVQAGAFDLGTSAVDYLDLSETTISRDVTVYHLLTHTSGIADDADEEAGERYEDLFIDRPNYALRNPIDWLPNFVTKPANFSPGAGYRYCNAGYVLLGLMIERSSGMSYRDYVLQHVFAPAGMTRSGFFRMDGVEPDVAEGVYPRVDGAGNVQEWRRNIYSYPPQGSSDGGAHATAGDLMAFHRALVGGRLLSADLTASILRPWEDQRMDDGLMHQTGFGFQFESKGGDLVSYGKEGVNVGASGVLQHYPRQEVTVVVLSNLEDGAWEPIEEVARQVAGWGSDGLGELE